MNFLKQFSKWQLIELGVLSVLTVAILIIGRAYYLCKDEINDNFAIKNYQEQIAASRLLEDNNRVNAQEGFDRLSYANTVLNSDAIQAGFSQTRTDALDRSDRILVAQIEGKQSILKSLGFKGKSVDEISLQNEALQDAIRYSMMSTAKQVMKSNQLQYKAEIYFGLLMFLNGLIVSMFLANLILKRKRGAISSSKVLVEVNS